MTATQYAADQQAGPGRSRTGNRGRGTAARAAGGRFLDEWTGSFVSNISCRTGEMSEENPPN